MYGECINEPYDMFRSNDDNKAIKPFQFANMNIIYTFAECYDRIRLLSGGQMVRFLQRSKA